MNSEDISRGLWSFAARVSKVVDRCRILGWDGIWRSASATVKDVLPKSSQGRASVGERPRELC